MIKKQKLFFFIMLFLAVIFWGCDKKETSEGKEMETSESAKTDELSLEEGQIEEIGVQFPIVLEDGKLEVESMFQFEGFNPDADNAMGTETAAISVKNLSDMYLEEAKITVLTDEGELMFVVTDLPKGSSARAFSIENKFLESNAVCNDVKSEAVFKDDVVGIPEQILVQEDGIQISVTNASEQSLSKVTVYCRCPFDEEYFGGAAYQYELQGLAAGETKVINAEDFLLGIVEVVRVEIE